ncbi:hypothetical protein FRX31_015345 [Thalictrum thalictroides]|uniref:Uncharacterized protein n=1 Tax=Thalictrum thalictroides TaxID=46969 RepID=A0A7J6WCG3_THATH|nr:hypothetical protein FRX31_015345 [Thalictrum thalictroides]
MLFIDQRCGWIQFRKTQLGHDANSFKHICATVEDVAALLGELPLSISLQSSFRHFSELNSIEAWTDKVEYGSIFVLSSGNVIVRFSKGSFGKIWQHFLARICEL